MAENYDKAKFKKELDELNKLKKQLGEEAVKVNFDFSGIAKLTEELIRARDLVKDTEGSIEGLSTQWRNISEQVGKTNQGYKLASGSLDKLKDISDKLRYSSQGISELSTKDIRLLKQKNQLAFADLKLSKQLLEERKKTGIATDQELSTLEEITAQLGGQSQTYQDQVALLNKAYKEQKRLETAQGLTGSILKGSNKILEKMGVNSDVLSEAFESASAAAESMAKRVTKGGTQAAGLSGKFRVAGAAIGALGKSLAKNLLDPLVIAGGLIKGIKGLFKGIVGGIKSIFGKIKGFLEEQFERGKNAARTFSEEIQGLARGLALTQQGASQLMSSIAGLGPTASSSKSAIEGIYSAMDSTEQLSANTLKTFIGLSTYAGYSADSLAEVQKMAKLTGQDAGVVADEINETAAGLIKQNKVATSVRSVFQDVAKVSNNTKLAFGNSTKAITAAVVQAKQLGINIDDVISKSKGFLDLEQSISAEQELQALTGKEVNLDKLRYAALTRDATGMSAELGKIVKDLGPDAKNNAVVFQQLAEATQMSEEELSNMLNASKTMKTVGKDLNENAKKGADFRKGAATQAEIEEEKERKKNASGLGFFKTIFPLYQKFEHLTVSISKKFSDFFGSKFKSWFGDPKTKKGLDELAHTVEGFVDKLVADGGLLSTIFNKIFGAGKSVGDTAIGKIGHLLEPGGAIYDGIDKLNKWLNTSKSSEPGFFSKMWGYIQDIKNSQFFKDLKEGAIMAGKGLVTAFTFISKIMDNPIMSPLVKVLGGLIAGKAILKFTGLDKIFGFGKDLLSGGKRGNTTDKPLYVEDINASGGGGSEITDLLGDKGRASLSKQLTTLFKKPSVMFRALAMKGGKFGKLIGKAGLAIGKFGSKLSPLFSKLGGIFGRLGSSIMNVAKNIGGYFKNIVGKIGSGLAGAAKSIFSGAKNLLSKAASGGKGLLSKAGGFLGDLGSKALSGVKSVGKGIVNVASKLNPMKLLKDGLIGKAGKFIGKAVKGGGLLSALFGAADIASVLADPKMNSLDKAKRIIPSAAGTIGGIIGSVAGSVLGPLGTFGGGYLGQLAGQFIGESKPIQEALAPPLAKALSGDEVAADFVMQGGKVQRFRKDDIVLGGTSLLGGGGNKGGDGRVVQLLERLVSAVEKGGNVYIDGNKVGVAIARSNYRTQ